MTQEKSSFLLRFAEAALPLLTLFLLFPLVLMVMQEGAPPKSKPKEVEERTWLVSSERAKFVDAAPYLTLYGKVVVPDAVRLSASIAAEVTQIHVREGQLVDKGQKLLSFDRLDAEALTAQRRAELQDIEARIELQKTQHAANQKSLSQERRLLSLTRTELKRTQSLRRRNAIPQSTVDAAKQAEVRQSLAVTQRQTQVDQYEATMAQLEANKARAEVAMRVAQRDLDSTEVVAPVAGKVVKINVRQGDRVAPGMVAMDLFDPSSAEIKAQIPVKHLPLLTAAVNDGVQLRASANVDGQKINAVLDRFAGEATRGGGVEAFFRLTSDDTVVQVGRGFKMALTLPVEKQVVALPFSAVYGLNRAYTIQDGRMKRINVERVGEQAGDNVKVLVRSNDLQGGEPIVISQLANAVQGLKVHPARPRGGFAVRLVHFGVRPEFYADRGADAIIPSTVKPDDKKRSSVAKLEAALQVLAQSLDVTASQVITSGNHAGLWLLYPAGDDDTRASGIDRAVQKFSNKVTSNVSIPVFDNAFETKADGEYLQRNVQVVERETARWLERQNLPKSEWVKVVKIRLESRNEMAKLFADRVVKPLGKPLLLELAPSKQTLDVWFKVSTHDASEQRKFAKELKQMRRKYSRLSIDVSEEYAHEDDLKDVEALKKLVAPAASTAQSNDESQASTATPTATTEVASK